MTRFLILGMGTAGLSAAEEIRYHQPSAAITMVSDDPHGYYSRPGLAYVLNRELPKSQLFPVSHDRWNRLAIKRVRARAVRIDPESRSVWLDTGQRVCYDRLLLALGSSAVPLQVPGAELDGVLALNSLQDVQRMIRCARQAREAVVVGGGVTAIEIVEGLHARGVQVHYAMRGARYWRSVLDEAESSLIEARLIEQGITIHHHTEIARILARRDLLGRRKVAGVQTTDGWQIRCQLVAVAVGVQPRLDLVAGTGIETERGIVVNDRLQTNIPGIYAAGDVAQVWDPVTGRSCLESLWPVAVAQGRVAGANMAGQFAVYERGIPANVTRLAGLVVALVGSVGTRPEPDADLVTISRGDSEAWRRLPDTIVVHDGHKVNRQRLIIKDNRLVGAVLIGEQSLFPMVCRLIRERVDIGVFLRALRSPQVDLARVLVQVQKDVA
jgi:NAD(P)H-nitrite reductase large subunit